ncbi:hypothetical protein CYMTET_22125, partial [Cymbomonas tetramitiformis]
EQDDGSELSLGGEEMIRATWWVEVGWVNFRVTDTLSGRSWEVSPAHDKFLNDLQKLRLARQPKGALQYAALLVDLMERRGWERARLQVHAHSCISMNGRPGQPLYVPSANLHPDRKLIRRYWRNLLLSGTGIWIEPLRPIQQAAACHIKPSYNATAMAETLDYMYMTPLNQPPNSTGWAGKELEPWSGYRRLPSKEAGPKVT